MNHRDPLIDQIVQQVLARLQSGSERSTAQSTDERAVLISDRVVTEAVLKANVSARSMVRLIPGAILTPTGREFLRRNDIRVSSVHPETPGETATLRSVVYAVSVSPTVRSLLDDLRADSRWAVEPCGHDSEAVTEARQELSRGGIFGGVVLSETPGRVACLGNRSPSIRAAEIRSVDDLIELRSSLNPNLLVVSPGGQSRFALLRLFREFASGPRPTPPPEWDE